MENSESQTIKIEPIHIGEIIKKELKNQERSEAWLARQVHCDSGNFNRILKKYSMDIQLLLRISVILKHNFIQDIASSYNKYL